MERGFVRIVEDALVRVKMRLMCVDMSLMHAAPGLTSFILLMYKLINS
jgi:hypothetical protein